MPRDFLTPILAPSSCFRICSRFRGEIRVCRKLRDVIDICGVKLSSVIFLFFILFYFIKYILA